MGNLDHIAILKKGVYDWNKWRLFNQDIQPDLTGLHIENEKLYDVEVENYGQGIIGHGDVQAYVVGIDLKSCLLQKANLAGCDLDEAGLQYANLSDAVLSKVRLYKADLRNAILANAILIKADLSEACISGADFSKANLSGATLPYNGINEADFRGANLVNCNIPVTALSTGENLTGAKMSLQYRKRLEKFRWTHRSLEKLKYVEWIDDEPKKFSSCFISYSSVDSEFAKKLYIDLTDNGVQCWFAPHDLPIGSKIRPSIDDAIRSHQKLLIILSANSINSNWVENEVETAFDEEIRRGKIVLFPIRLDNTVLETSMAWATSIKMQRNIGDFTNWNDQVSYTHSFERLLKDLIANK